MCFNDCEGDEEQSEIRESLLNGEKDDKQTDKRTNEVAVNMDGENDEMPNESNVNVDGENDEMLEDIIKKVALWSDISARLGGILGSSKLKDQIDMAMAKQLGVACDRFLKREGLRRRVANGSRRSLPQQCWDRDTFFNPSVMESQMRTSLQSFVESSNEFLDVTLGFASLMAGFQFLGIEKSQQKDEKFGSLKNMSQFLLVISFVLNAAVVGIVMCFKANLQTHLRLTTNDYVDTWPEIYRSKVIQHMTKPLLASLLSTLVMAISIVLVAYEHFEPWQFWVIAVAVSIAAVLSAVAPRLINVKESYKDIMDRVDRYYQPWFWVRDPRKRTGWKRLKEEQAAYRLQEVNNNSQ